MKENVGTIDRVGRSFTGSALLVLGYEAWGGSKGSPAGLAAMIAATAILESVITRVCPLNALFGLDTREPELVRKDLQELPKAE